MNFSSDCANCAALCCHAFAFEAGPDFAEGKAAGLGCVHLAGHACGIHAERESRGYGGCLSYECQGAGPAASALFPPARSGEAPAVSRARLEAFRILCTVHAIGAALERNALPDELAGRIRSELEPQGGWTYSALLDFDRSGARSRLLGQIAGVIHKSEKAGFLVLTA